MKLPANTPRRRNTACSCGRQQVVAPFERRAQRLVAPQQHSRAPGQHLEAFVQARPQAFQAEQRQARDGQLDGQRNAVQPAADLGDRRQGPAVRFETRNDGPRARDEEFQGTEVTGGPHRCRFDGTAREPRR